MSHDSRSPFEQELENLGWNPYFNDHFTSFREQQWLPARVVREDRFLYRVHSQDGLSVARVSGRSAGRAEDKGDFPAVGDWVALERQPAQPRDVIHAILPRRSAFLRQVVDGRSDAQVVAANMDAVFLVCGLDGDFNLRRIERYITMSFGCGAEPVIILNKADACADIDARLNDVASVAPGIAAFAISATASSGIEQLAPYLVPGCTVALIGSSGVGKSTLVNLLLGEERFGVNAVRVDDSRGRHTTTRRELVIAPSGAILIDTPGMRGLSSWSEEGVSSTFADIEELMTRCRFRDCGHGPEPGCAVKGALESGELDQGRLDNYRKLQREFAEAAERRRIREQEQQDGRKRPKREEKRKREKQIARRRRGNKKFGKDMEF